MRSLTRFFELLKAQLGGFSLAAKALIGAVLVVMVLALLLVAQLTGNRQLMPLGISMEVGEDVRARAAAYLDQRGIRYEVRANDLWVPPNQKYDIYAALAANDLIAPEQIDFEKLLRDPSPFTDRETKRQQYLVATQNKVERMIVAQTGVRSASVVVSMPVQKTGLGAARIRPSASVTVQPSGPSLDSRQANGIARLVAAAFSGMDVADVTVMDLATGRAMSGVPDSKLGASLLLEHVQLAEAYVEDKIRELLVDIPGLLVAARVELVTERTQGRRTSVQKPVTGVNREATRESSSENSYVPQEPGVRANVGGAMSLRNAGRASRRSESTSETDLTSVFPNEQETFDDPGGQFRRVNVSMRVPRSWLAQLWRLATQAAADQEPTDADLAPIRDARLASLRETVAALVDMTAADEGAVAGTVTVIDYDDRPAALATGMLPGATGRDRGAGVVGMLVSEGLISTVAVVLLGAVSLGLMFMMVRKATRDEELPSPEELVGIPPALAEAEDDLVGEARETDAALEGVEIDEATVRRSQMLEQINQLARKEPEEAASLVRKWIRADGQA